MMKISYNISESTMGSVERAIVGAVSEAVEYLAAKHGFSAADAMDDMNLVRASGVKKVKKSIVKERKPSIPLPWCGVVQDSCYGIRVNHGLFTQCHNARAVDVDSGKANEYCKTCCGQAGINDSGAPNAGDIRARLGGDWDAPAKLVSYGNVMKKLNITREDAERVATEFDQVIPEEQFAVVTGRRGRPKKDNSTSSSDEDSAPKKRGRPKKDKKVVTSTGDDLIAQLVAQAKETSSSGSDSEGAVDKKAVADAKKAVADAKKEAAVAKKEAADAAKAEKLEAKAEKLAAKEADKEARNVAKQEKLEAKQAAKDAKQAAKDADDLVVQELVAKTQDGVDEAKLAKQQQATNATNASVVATPTLVAPADDDVELAAESSDSEEEEVSVVAFVIDGKDYLINHKTNILYSTDDHTQIGQWDEASSEIKDIESEDEESDDDDE